MRDRRYHFERICLLCDARYDIRDIAEAKIHLHPEPQSGPYRDAWLASRLPYERWIVETAEGANYKSSQRRVT